MCVGRHGLSDLLVDCCDIARGRCGCRLTVACSLTNFNLPTNFAPCLSLVPTNFARSLGEKVDRKRAEEFVNLWTEQLREHRAKIQAAAASNSNGDTASSSISHPWILCDRIRLSDKSYTIEAAQVIASFLTEPLFHDYPPLAHGITEADLSDIIAGRLTAEGILVLRLICSAFANSNLIEVDLSENAIGEQAIGACETVVTLKSLERLSLCNNGFSGETMTTVADLLTRDNDGAGCIAGNLTKIHFFNNMTGEEG